MRPLVKSASGQLASSVNISTTTTMQARKLQNIYKNKSTEKVCRQTKACICCPNIKRRYCTAFDKLQSEISIPDRKIVFLMAHLKHRYARHARYLLLPLPVQKIVTKITATPRLYLKPKEFVQLKFILWNTRWRS